MPLRSLLPRCAALAAALAPALAATDYQHTCADSRAVYEHVGCCANDGAGFAANMLTEMQRVRFAYYEHLRETTDYLSRVYNPKINAANVNGSEVLPFLIETNRIILQEEEYSIVNDWWYNTANGQFMEVQFFDKRSVNMSMTSDLSTLGTFHLIMEHLTKLATHPDIGFAKVGAFFDTSDTNFGNQNLRLSRLKTPEERHFFDFFYNLSVASGNAGLANKDMSGTSYAELLDGFQWLLLN